MSPSHDLPSHVERKLIRRSAWSRLLHWPLALLFFYSGSVKLLDLKAFAQSVGDFGIVWDWLVHPVAWLVCVGELVLGICLLWRLPRAALAAGILLLVFVGVLSYGIALGLDIKCGCFGGQKQFSLQSQRSIDLMLVFWCAAAHLTLRNELKTVSKG